MSLGLQRYDLFVPMQAVWSEIYSVNWEGAVFLDGEKHWRGSRIMEVLFINSHNPTRMINQKKKS